MQSKSSKRTVAVLMTCFNRREITLAGLRSLREQVGLQDCELAVYLVDDGSRDGTWQAVEQEFPEVHLLRGDGSLFWNGGMRKAFAAAMKSGHDGYLWFNDDTVLLKDAIQRLLQCEANWKLRHPPAIVAGSVKDAKTGERTYGGFRMNKRGLSMKLEPVQPDPRRGIACDSMNGNLVFIPEEVAGVLGNLEKRFRHQIGDVDYGLRARAAGFDVVLAPDYFGFCSSNPSAGTWRDRSLPFARRWKNLMSPKGAPFGEWLLYTRRHYGWRWPMYFLSPYCKTVFSSFARARG